MRSKFSYTVMLGAILLLQLSFSAHATITTVVDGASYQPVVAPNSWAVAFGTALAQTTASATLTAAGQWPTTLGGVTVQVNSQPAELYYVSPSQINFLVPDGTDFGSLSVVITNVASGGTQTSNVTVQNTAVGLFSSDSSGAGPGAILNGVTYGAAPFLVETSQNGGTDLRTRLAVYCTGLRYAGNPTHDPSTTNATSAVTAQGKDAAGNQYNFVVEYAGVAPGYIGLDQVNIILPAQLDAAGVVSLTILADASASNVVTFQVNGLPASSIRLLSLALSSNEITGGSSLTGTVSLNGVAPATGFPVSLRSSSPTVVLPGVAAIAQGQASGTFTINTPSNASVQTVTITAQAGSSTQTATLQLDPSTVAQLGAFTLSAVSVQGGTSVTGTLGLTSPAPLGGATVLISSSNAAAQPPASVAIQANSSSNTFTIPTSTVTAPQAATLTAALGSQNLTAPLAIVPALQLSLADSSVTGGASVTATVTLGTAAPTGGAVFTVSSSAPSVAQASGGVVSIAAGQTTATFTISTFSVTAARSVTITVTSATLNLSQTSTLTVNPQIAGQLQSLSVAPTQVSGGSSAVGTVTLTGPASIGGVVVQLKTSNVLITTVPFTVNVVQGQTSATFMITTSKVASSQTVTITAIAGTVTETAPLTVN